eukprot:m.197183 g.197183  ORF g.197183 m.197183 type:complete len:733 (-) comp18344_c0_seq1:352-2550(-)
MRGAGVLAPTASACPMTMDEGVVNDVFCFGGEDHGTAGGSGSNGVLALDGTGLLAVTTGDGDLGAVGHKPSTSLPSDLSTAAAASAAAAAAAAATSATSSATSATFSHGEGTSSLRVAPPRSHFGSTSSNVSDDCDITSLGLMDWSNFSTWMTCICVVKFDLELGQSLETVYPHTHPLTPEEMKNISYLAFPDSNSGCMGNHQFTFRIRASKRDKPMSARGGGSSGAKSSAAAAAAAFAGAGPAANCEGAGADACGDRRKPPKYFYGSVLFRQIPDPTSRRGYFQKSVVVISERLHVGLYTEVASRVALAYFENGNSALESACLDICRWPPPDASASLTLPLLGAKLQARLLDAQLGSFGTKLRSKASVPELHASIEPASFLQTLRPLLSHAQTLWELMLTAEPLLVISPTPTACSNAVLALVGLVGPTLYQGDYRPYFTIHDPDCPRIVKKGQKPGAMVLGVTNPYFSKALEHWPHVVRVGLMHQARHSSANLTPMSSTVVTGGSASRALHSGSPTLGGRICGKQGLFTSYKPLLEQDKAFLKPLLKAAGPAQDPKKLGSSIRNHFAELTQSFLIPLEQYVMRLMPLKSTISAFKVVPTLGTFSPRDFLKSVAKSPAPLSRSRRGNWLTLYANFLKSPNFRAWWTQRQRDANSQLVKQFLEQVMASNLEAWAKTQSELQVIDVYVRIHDAVRVARDRGIMSHASLKAVVEKTAGVVEQLPQDLRASLQMRQ